MPKYIAGDIVRNKSSGYYWKIKSGYTYKDYVLEPVPKEWGIKTGKSETAAYYYQLELVAKDKLEKLIEQKGIDNMEKLYEFTHEGKTLFGTKLAVNSEGLWVMDVKGGAPVAIASSSAKEVIPHSVEVRSLFDGNKYHMMIEKGKVVKGGVYVAKTGGIYTVLDVNTEVKTCKTFEPITRLVTEEM